MLVIINFNCILVIFFLFSFLGYLLILKLNHLFYLCYWLGLPKLLVNFYNIYLFYA